MPSTFFRDNLLSYLPVEFAQQDRGIQDLSDYLEIVAVSQDEFQDFLDEFPTIFDVDECEAKYLPYLAKMLNYPLSGRDTEASQRLQLKYAVEWYKRKGLHESFRILFYSLGYVITLRELWTRDYLTFHRYPGTFQPTVFPAFTQGVGVPVSISNATKRLRVSIDGSPPVDIVLNTGVLRALSAIATEIDAALASISGDCVIEGGRLTIKSRSSGSGSIVKLHPTENPAYTILQLQEGSWWGIDDVVPDDWHELHENAGKWYKSPHFGIEVFSIKDFVLDPEEFNYIRERIELVRPAHTVLDWIDYIKGLADAFSPSEGNFIAQITPELADAWPFPVCIDRGALCEYEYLRDGLVPDRSDETRIAYVHKRNALDNCARRSDFDYEYTQLTRNTPTGHALMPLRDTIRYFRAGRPEGTPDRTSCAFDSEIVDMILGFEVDESWCSELLRDGGAYYRNTPDTHYRDGSFTLLTSRMPHEIDRDGFDTLLTRSGCFPILDNDDFLLFARNDLPGVWFTSLAAMTNPYVLDLPELPGPGEGGGVPT